MNKFLCVLFLMVFLQFFNVTSVVAQQDTTTVYTDIEIAPEPPGGMAAFMQWIGANYRYPKKAIDKAVQGKIAVSFVVERDGAISDIKVIRDLGYGTGAEAVRVLKRAPKWSPGIQKGRAVRVQYTMPITLSL